LLISDVSLTYRRNYWPRPAVQEVLAFVLARPRRIPSTMIAAEKSGRRARLMELDPKFVDVIVKRWQMFTGRKATLESEGQCFDDVSAERLGPQ
jgi:hypothetical protein